MWLPDSVLQSGDNAAIASVATAAARESNPQVDVEVLWEGMWVLRVGDHFFPDPDLFASPDPNWQRRLTSAEKYLRDADDYWLHVYKPRSGDTIVDVGAGRGEDVFAFSPAVREGGCVWAIEPHPVSFFALELLCRLNRLDNVQRLNVACTDIPADLQIETMPVWESNYVRTGPPSPASHPVKGVPFDSLARQYGIGRIDFLKMNIEGAERNALPGCAEALQRTQNVCVAAHDFRALRGEGDQFRTLDFVHAFLKDAGFEIAMRNDDPRYYVPYHVHGYRSKR